MRFIGRIRAVFLLMGVLALAVGCNLLNSPPAAVFTASPSVGTAPLTVSFNASASSDADGEIVGYDWEFGDGSVGTSALASHTYQSTGTYAARLTVHDDAGRSGHAAQDIYVATEVTYDDLFRNNESYIGDVIYCRGKIIQVQEQLFSGYVWRVATERNEYFGYIGDNLWVNYNGPRFLEGDIIDLCGKVKGLRTYSSIFGQQVTIPEIDALGVSLCSE